MHLEVGELLLYLGSLLTVPFNLLLELLLPPLLATAVHPVINSLIDLICFTIVSFIRCRGKQTTTISSKLREDGEATVHKNGQVEQERVSPIEAQSPVKIIEPYYK